MRSWPEMVGTMVLILRAEMQRFFAEARHLTVVLIVLGGIPFALSYQVPSPFISAAVVGLVLAERWMMDMFDQKGREFTKFSVYPLSWESVVFGKEVVAIVIALGGSSIAALVYSWLRPSPPSGTDALRAAVAYLCLLLPVVQVGGSTSVLELQKPFRTPVDMAVRALMCLIAAALSGIPVLILLALSGTLLPLVLYFCVLCVLWYLFGIRMTAERIRQWQTSPGYDA